MYENPEVIFGGERRLLDLVALIYACVDEPALWFQVLDGIADILRSGPMIMLTNYHHPSIEDIHAFARTDPDYIKLFTHYAPMNIWARPADRAFPDGTVRYGCRLVPERILERSEYYNDFIRLGNGWHSVGIRIPLQGLRPVSITTMRPKDRGPYEDSEGAVFITLLPHFQRALRLSFERSLMNSALRTSFERLSYGLILLDAKGKAILLNPEAQRILDKRDGMCLDRGTVYAQSNIESRRLRDGIASATQRAAGRVVAGGNAMLISRNAGAPLQVIVEPYISGLGDVPARIAATVSVRDPDTVRSAPDGQFRALYGLTRAEARLATLLVEGRNLTEAAAMNRVTRETVRSQLKSIFQKTGTRRQSELLRLLTPCSARPLF